MNSYINNYKYLLVPRFPLKTRISSHIGLVCTWPLHFHLVRLILPLVSRLSFKRNIFRPVSLRLEGNPLIQILGRILSVIGALTLKPRFIRHIVKQFCWCLGFQFWGNITFLVFCFSLKLSSSRKVVIGRFDRFWKFNFIGFISCLIGRFNDLRIVFTLRLFIGRSNWRLIAYFIRFVVLMIARLSIKWLLWLWTGVFSWIDRLIPQVQISQTHWWSCRLLLSGLWVLFLLGVCINKNK